MVSALRLSGQNSVSVCVCDRSGPSSQTRMIQQDGPVLLFAGRFLALKGLDLLLRAFAAVPSKDAQLHLLGDGPEKQRLEHLTQRLGNSEPRGLAGHEKTPPGFVWKWRKRTLHYCPVGRTVGEPW